MGGAVLIPHLGILEMENGKSAIKEGGGRLIANFVKNFHFFLALPLPC